MILSNHTGTKPKGFGVSSFSPVFALAVLVLMLQPVLSSQNLVNLNLHGKGTLSYDPKKIRNAGVEIASW